MEIQGQIQQQRKATRPQARYLVIADDLSRRIANSDWMIGDFLPSEPDLAAEYGVSRETLRSALRQMESEGLISRRKGQGTRVRRQNPSTEFFSRLSSIDDLVSYGQTATRTILDAEPVALDPAMARTTGFPPGFELVRITTTRQGEANADRVVSWSRVYLAAEDWAAIAEEIGGSDRLVADLVASHKGRTVDSVVQRIRAITVPAEAAGLLRIDEGSPALELTRQYVDREDGIFVVVVSLHPGETYVYETVLEPRQS